MTALKIGLTIVFVLVSIAVVGIVLIQDGESGGLSGSISGGGETFWNKNKNRSAEGKIEKVTKYLVVAFMVLSLLLNLPVFG
ncbi:MAG: preprotein translocase subunit SecG [Lachnospiraceae bacterium]|jgi:preprotein translocase subunit SecG|nr:preprotein translocase subunit SecG [Lachnospiraceae bacterium]